MAASQGVENGNHQQGRNRRTHHPTNHWRCNPLHDVSLDIFTTIVLDGDSKVEFLVPANLNTMLHSMLAADGKR
ncbi:MAG: hypothetical protein ACREI2_07035 [Nitrospiraceae bacterium]